MTHDFALEIDDVILQINVRKINGKYVATIDVKPTDIIEFLKAGREAAEAFQREAKAWAAGLNRKAYGFGNKSK